MLARNLILKASTETLPCGAIEICNELKPPSLYSMLARRVRDLG